MAAHQIALPVPRPFDLRLALFGHGWIDLAPHTWHVAARRFDTSFEVEGRVVDVAVDQPTRTRLRLRVEAKRPLGRRALSLVRASVARQLRLDQDLAGFWTLCRAEPRLRWVARRGAGRLLRSPTLFEDLLKILFTTNCTWSNTRAMTRRVVDALGEPGPGGRRAFPSAQVCARQPESFWRDAIRVGYRAGACRTLAGLAARGELSEESLAGDGGGTEIVRRRLLALPGFGPYAAGQALRLLGHYEDLALDSWCRAELARQRAAAGGPARAPADSAIRRHYRSFGVWAGLALWMDLTAGWHQRPPRSEL